MKTRLLKLYDIPLLKEINSRCHPDDAFPDFRNFIGEILVITDNQDKIISVGGVDLIAEAITITDNEFSSHIRTTALWGLFSSMKISCRRANHSYLHAFVNSQDKIHIKTLGVIGFKPLNSKAFVIGVNDG